MVAPQTREGWLSEQRKYRQFTPEQKAEIVLAGLRDDRSVRDVCREYQIAETLYITEVQTGTVQVAELGVPGQMLYSHA